VRMLDGRVVGEEHPAQQPRAEQTVTG
jgi:hypothetical protein